MLTEKLREYYPDNWTDHFMQTIYDKMYYLQDVQRKSEEYDDVLEPFRDYLCVYRVQHPLAYLRYMLQTECLQEQNLPNDESIVYHKVKTEDKDVALSYNCDDRRYKHSTKNFHSIPIDFGSDEVLIVLKKREGDFEKDRWPMYTIHSSLFGYKYDPTRVWKGGRGLGF